jgi:indole-3-glycerol phosphate synthase
VVTDDPTVPPALLSNFTDKYYFDGKYDDLSAIIDDQLIASLSADEQIAFRSKAI